MSVLYVVPTPIGNLNDMVPRAVSVLQQVDCIAAEDTRHSSSLLNFFDIKTRMVAYHEHNEKTQTEFLLSLLRQGKSIAVISDAGTPLISDPGYRLVKEAGLQGFSIVPIPGAVAAVAALSASGLPSDRFIFEGFLPAKKGRRRSAITERVDQTATMIFYESPHRVLETIQDMADVFGVDRKACVARELSKQYETIKTACFAELLEWMTADANQQRGEFVILVEGAPPRPEAVIDAYRLLKRLADSMPPNKAAALVAELSDLNKRELYQYLLDN